MAPCSGGFPEFPEYLEDLKVYINGDLQAVTATGNPLISTGDNLDLMLGTNYAANHFPGVLDEIRRERGLSSNECKKPLPGWNNGLTGYSRLPNPR